MSRTMDKIRQIVSPHRGKHVYGQPQQKRKNKESTVHHPQPYKLVKPVDAEEKIRNKEELQEAESMESFVDNNDRQVGFEIVSDSEAAYTMERMAEKLEKDDFLLKQIDEFREKAKKLQGLLDSKEEKAQQLQSIVDAREEKAQQLQQTLNERQSEANELLNGVHSQMDEMLDRVESKLTSISDQLVTDVTGHSEKQTAQMQEMMGRVEEKLNSISDQIVNDVHDAGSRTVEQTAQMQESLKEISSQLDTMKLELSEKIHAEDVKCYRNMQNLIEDLAVKLEDNEELEQSLANVKGYVKCLAWFAIIDFVVLVIFILYSIGAFNFV
ncbi:MAG: hypothetical protein ACI4DO_07860 [Roseburia sp.]